MRVDALPRLLSSRWLLLVVLIGLVAASLVPAPAALAAGGVRVVGQGSGRCLDVAHNNQASGGRVIIYDCNGGDNQAWTLTAAGELRVFAGALCLDVTGQDRSSPATVQTYRCNGGDNQRWTVHSNGTITGVQSGLCLDVKGRATANSSVVELYTCNGGSNQDWSLGTSVTQLTTDTDLPWGLVTLPDGSILYSRRDAFDLVLLNPVTHTKTNAGTVPNVAHTNGEGGLLGLAVSPTFATDHWLYIMRTTATDNRIARFKFENGQLNKSSEDVLVTGILRNTYHNGGRLRFGPDGKLYASTGDAQNGDNAQNKAGLNGKVLRINPDGAVPSDNPFGNYVWSYGHRNPQGLAFDSQGRLWEQEFGNNVMDETNLITKGGNYGWPSCEGTTGNGCGTAGFIAPKHTYPTADGSCAGIAIQRDVLYIACERGERLYRAAISGTSLTGVQSYFVGTYGRLRTVEPAPDGGLWLTTSNEGDKDSVANNSNEKVLHVTLGR